MTPILEAARRAVQAAAAIVAAIDGPRLQQLVDAVALIRATARVACLGVGKSGIVAHKIAATLAATGQPAYFVHATEALHGDLGMIGDADVALVVSCSGNSSEIAALLPHLRVPVIALCGNRDSALGQATCIFLDSGVVMEPAAMASSVGAIVMGDALACALMASRGLEREDLAALHPAGDLGKRLRAAA